MGVQSSLQDLLVSPHDRDWPIQSHCTAYTMIEIMVVQSLSKDLLVSPHDRDWPIQRHCTAYTTIEVMVVQSSLQDLLVSPHDRDWPIQSHGVVQLVLKHIQIKKSVGIRISAKNKSHCIQYTIHRHDICYFKEHYISLPGKIFHYWWHVKRTGKV